MNYDTMQILYNCIKKYWYCKYFPISCDFCTEFDYFTPKYQIYDKFSLAIDNIAYIILWTTDVQNFYTMSSSNINTTNIFQFSVIFA